MRLLVTGANGFVGGALMKYLALDRPSWKVRGSVRAEEAVPAERHGAELVVVGDLAARPDWSLALTDVDVVVHCAAKVHVRQETARAERAVFRAVNVDACLDLAAAAMAAGCRRFVFLSSAKVFLGPGDSRHQAQALAAEWLQDPYTASKREAEEALRVRCADSGVQCVIVRPPLVYGPGVGGNFKTLIRAVAKGLPLPIGAIRNRRSFVAVGNLVHFLACVAEHPDAAGQTFAVSDDEDVSTPELARRLAKAAGRGIWMPEVPVDVLIGLAGVLGRRSQMLSLCESLALDVAETRSLLGWSPPIGMDVGLAETVEDFLERTR